MAGFFGEGLRARVLSALIGVPILVAVVWFGEPWFSLGVALVAGLAAREFFHLASQTGGQPLTWLGVLGSLAFVANGYQEGSYSMPLLALAVILPLMLLLGRRPLAGAFAAWAWTLAGTLYVGFLLSYFPLLRQLEGGREWVLFTVFTVFACDTSAYFVGRWLGRRPFFSAISPKKTWEGAVGGAIGALVAALVLWALLRLSVGWPQALFLGVLLTLFAQIGDLTESMLKRSAGIKDAGHLIPGHGGMLDRLDSLLFPVVIVYYYVVWVVL